MDFEDMFKKSLSVVNEGFRAAYNDLDDLVSSLSEAIRNIAGERFDIGFSEIHKEIKSTTYRVYLDPDTGDIDAQLLDFSYIRIPSKGYPIVKGGSVIKGTNILTGDVKIENKEQLAEAFAAFIQDPDSPLIQSIGYALRNSVDD